MKIDSLAFQTDLYFHRFNGNVVEYDNFLVVQTPTNPKFFWGNLLYFKNPPQMTSLLEWRGIFIEKFNSLDVEHMTFAWDSLSGEEGESSQFIADGFNLEKSIVMVNDQILIPKKINSNLEIRAIVSEQDWQMVIDNHVAIRAQHFKEEAYRKFTIKKIANYRLMIAQNLGMWMGAFLGEILIGDLGFFHQNGLGRFQTVGTHPDYRRMGACSTLMYQTLLLARDYLNVSKFVIVADPDYFACEIYQSVGFFTKEIQVGLCKFNKDVWVT